MTSFVRIAVLGAVLSTGCADPALQQKVADLEGRIAKIEEGGAKAAAAPGAAAPSADQPPQEALDMFRDANEKMKAGDNDGAKALLAQIMEKYGSTKVGPAAQRLMDQLSVVGKEITDLKIEEWYSGKGALADSKATLVVFWEVWCPHCIREVPKLQETYTKFQGKGLGIIGLTKVTKGKTPEDVKAFIAENKVTYPIAKEAGDMSQFFGVSGVPAAAVVKGGKVVWRGHPAQVTEDMINGWIGG